MSHEVKVGIEIRMFSELKDDQSLVKRIPEFHLEMRKWEESQGQNKFSDIYDSQEDLSNIPEFYNKDEGEVFLAIDDQWQLIGLVALKMLGDTKGELKRLAVDPDYQGKGIGTGLMDALINHAQGKIEKIILATGKKENAKPLYEKFGFEVVGEDIKSNDWIMEKIL